MCLYVRGREKWRGWGCCWGLTRIEMRAAFLCGGRSERQSCSEDRLRPFLSRIEGNLKRCLVPKGSLSHCSTGKNNSAGFYPKCELCCLRVSSSQPGGLIRPQSARSLSSIRSHSAGITFHQCRHHGKIFNNKRKCIQSEIERHVFLLVLTSWRMLGMRWSMPGSCGMSGLGEEASAGPRCARTAQFRIAVAQIRCPGLLEEIWIHNMPSCPSLKSAVWILIKWTWRHIWYLKMMCRPVLPKCRSQIPHRCLSSIQPCMHFSTSGSAYTKPAMLNVTWKWYNNFHIIHSFFLTRMKQPWSATVCKI